jgi:hypothetical protein
LAREKTPENHASSPFMSHSCGDEIILTHVSLRGLATLLGHRKRHGRSANSGVLIMMKKFVNALMAMTLALGVTASTVGTAEARHGRGLAVGIAAGIIGLGIASAIAHEHRYRHGYYYRSSDECYPGPERCGWVNRHCFVNSWGDRVCRGGRWTCWRPTYCD